jgi:hypothetical protein
MKNTSIFKNITSRLGAKLLLSHSSLNLDEQTRECQKLNPTLVHREGVELEWSTWDMGDHPPDRMLAAGDIWERGAASDDRRGGGDAPATVVWGEGRGGRALVLRPRRRFQAQDERVTEQKKVSFAAKLQPILLFELVLYI